ncbi:MAG: 6-bladed beta-propeller [Thermomicrobiales bacterium]|nr:6-bladed beta-propeller [Thermomicrobiales bacterium]
MSEQDDINLSRFWDAYVAGVPDAVDIDQSTAEPLRYVHTLFAAPKPGSARERARQRVFDISQLPEENTMSANVVPIPLTALGGAPAQPRYRLADAAPVRRRWVLASAAALLLLLVGGIASYFTLVPPEDRLFGGDGGNRGLVPAAQAPFDPSDVNLEWETDGGQDMPMVGPLAVAIAPDGNVYVASGGNTIDVFSADGDHLETWGTEGDGPGEFLFNNRSFALANLEFDADGNLYVFDTLNHRIQKFGPDHSFILEWGSYGVENPGQFDMPMGAIDNEAHLVYVVDRTGRVQVFDLDGNYQMQWGSSGSGPGEFITPAGIAIDAAGNVYIADEGAAGGPARVQQFDPIGTLIEGAGVEGSFFSGFDSIAFYLEFDPNGNLFVSAWHANAIWIVSPDGRLIGNLGEVPLELPVDGPGGMAFDADGNIYVASENNNRLFKLALPPLS